MADKKVRGKKYQEAREKIIKDRSVAVAEAVKEVKSAAFAKFDEAVEVHAVLGIDPKNADQRIRFNTTLPHGTGKTVKVLVISDDNSGEKDNVLYRDESAIADIVAGKLKPETDFNMVIATPAKMKDMAKAARILGPKGLMPSPKNGTVTEKPENALKDLAKGQIEIKSQPNHAVIHQSVGTVKFTDEQLTENIQKLLEDLNKNTPAKMKKKLVQKVFVCTTMGPSVRVDA